MLSFPVLSFPVLSFPVLSFPVLSFFVLSFLVISFLFGVRPPKYSLSQSRIVANRKYMHVKEMSVA